MEISRGGSIFENLRAQVTSSKFQAPNCNEAPSSKLKNQNQLARGLPRHLFLGLVFEMWNFLWSLEFGASSFAQRQLKSWMRPCVAGGSKAGYFFAAS